jgi:hypothetical protein
MTTTTGAMWMGSPGTTVRPSSSYGRRQRLALPTVQPAPIPPTLGTVPGTAGQWITSADFATNVAKPESYSNAFLLTTHSVLFNMVR